MQYYNAKWKLSVNEKKYRIYLTDINKAIAEGKTISERYVDWIEKKPDIRDADEIVLDVMKNAGLKFKED